MRKIELTDQSGRWFNHKRAEEFSSKAVKDKTRIETIFLTTKGNWVLYSTSAKDPGQESFVKINSGEALLWFLSNGYDRDTLPQNFFSTQNEI